MGTAFDFSGVTMMDSSGMDGEKLLRVIEAEECMCCISSFDDPERYDPVRNRGNY